MPRQTPRPTAAPPPANPPRRYASLTEAAEYLGVNMRTIRRLIASGRLTGYRWSGRIIRVDLNELDAAGTVIPTTGLGSESA